MSWQKGKYKSGERGAAGELGQKSFSVPRACHTSERPCCPPESLRLLYIYFRFIVMSSKKIAQLAFRILASLNLLCAGSSPAKHFALSFLRHTRIWYAVCVLRPDRTCRKRTWLDTGQGTGERGQKDTEAGPSFHTLDAHRTWLTPLMSGQLAVSTLGPNIESNVYVSASGLSPCPSHSARTFVFHFKFLSYSPVPLFP